MRYEDSIRINAPAAIVWDLTVDVSRWPEFVSTMRRIEPLDPAPLGVGGRVRVKQPLQPPVVWTVTELEPGRRFVWQARRPGLAMVAGHTVEDLGGGECRNTLTFEATGWGAGGFRLLLGAAVRGAIARENQGFRDEAERLARHERPDA